MSTSAQAFAAALPNPHYAREQKTSSICSSTLLPRRSTADQAHALQTIAHAIEYLLDSRLFDAWQSPTDAAAVHILMGCSRQVFKQCEVLDAWPSRVAAKPMHALRVEPRLSPQ